MAKKKPMADMIPAAPGRMDPRVPMAQAQGPANLNETLSEEERAPQKSGIPETNGPRIDEPTGAYLPAKYPRERTIQTVNGVEKTFKFTRVDR